MRRLGRRAFLLGAAGISALTFSDVIPASVAYANANTVLRDQVFTLVDPSMPSPTAG